MIITFMNLFVLPGDRSEPGPGVQSKLHCASVTVSLSHSDWLEQPLRPARCLGLS